jgi:hypothetical protein
MNWRIALLMVPLIGSAGVAQAQVTEPPPEPQPWLREQTVRPLPGQLNQVPVFNSNSPELVLKEGILLSTFPAAGKQHPEAHLDFLFEGQFDLFAHHIAKADPPEDLRTLYMGILVHNPSRRSLTINILQGASYLSQPDAPFIGLDPWLDASQEAIYAGPGSRVMGELLRGQSQADLPIQVVVPPGQEQMLLNLPIPVAELDPPINGRSTLLHLRSNGPVYMASLAMFAKPLEVSQDSSGSKADPEVAEPAEPILMPERAPTLAEWRDLLTSGELSGPRDRPPTPIDAPGGSVIYGRVAGVALGSQWQAELTDPGQTDLAIPEAGSAFSYGISTLHVGRMGTGQNQSGSMVMRYPDTAYEAHGNYGVEYNLTLPLVNPTDTSQRVAIALETPIKEDVLSQPGLRFFEPLPNRIFFRGLVRVRYTDDGGLPRTRYVHLVQRRGEAAEPLVWLEMAGGDRRLVQVDLLYPPDSTPPQMLTVKTAAQEGQGTWPLR